ncbi:MAG: ABC transporter ATP-binding protein [Arenicellales bacterium]|jgi:putative ABC transport system ATP-binding protein|nr:ABC transporter ATP-binding protein [Arenicellales bacterium]
MKTPIIQARGLSRDYTVGAQTVNALIDFSIDIRHGEFVAIMGPSGSGKSTCMHLLGCLDTPTAGKYQLDGEDVSTLDADALAGLRQRRIGFVFQSFNLLAGASAIANVELPLVYGGVPRVGRLAQAAAALDSVGLTDRAHYLPTQLSGGQMQRVAIARAIVNRPALVLADEPTGALDTQTGQEIMALLAELNRSGITIVLITHEAEIAAYAQRVLFFRDGRLIEDRNASGDLLVRPPSGEDKL